MKTLRSYQPSMAKWITVFDSEYYPDTLDAALPIYAGVIRHFGEMILSSSSSAELLETISDTPVARRIQLLRIFRRYVSPDTSVEMLKIKARLPNTISEFGDKFRDIELVRKQFANRKQPDEALIALLNEYRERGKKGYDLSEIVFDWFEDNLGEGLLIDGPRRAGKDIVLQDYLEGYPSLSRPVDFIISDRITGEPYVVGLIRYDSDRGGAQEDDRVGGYRDVVSEVLEYARERNKPLLKLVFLNDGPGLLLGSMWRDYCSIEDSGNGRVMVATMKMLPERLTEQWIRPSE